MSRKIKLHFFALPSNEYFPNFFDKSWIPLISWTHYIDFHKGGVRLIEKGFLGGGELKKIESQNYETIKLQCAAYVSG